ncbi:MAG: hypothetical protein M5U26_18610 [Planctomycetota bacterium]|nr:hypothetical protein [Planctomycetota bacterium]
MSGPAPARARLLALPLLALLAAPAGFLRAGQPEPEDAYAAKMAQGKASFGKRKYTEALGLFREALGHQPDSYYGRFYAGLAAYWAGQPADALPYIEGLLRNAEAGSAREWELQRHRVMILSALDRRAEADQAVRRLYQLRANGGPEEARKEEGFIREHLYHQTWRIGAWEVFDEHGEKSTAWEFPVVDPHAADERLLRKYRVVLTVRKGGPVYELVEEGAGATRIFYRWPRRPDYAQAREQLLAALEGRLQPLEDPKLQPGQPAPPPPEDEPEAQRQFTEAEQERMAQALKAGLEPGATRILQVAARLALVDYDISKAVRLSVADPDAAQLFEQQHLDARFPHAREDASRLVRFVTRASKEDCEAAFSKLPLVMQGVKGPYVYFVLLTAINTRGNPYPPQIVESCLQSKDFMVRRTASLMLARTGIREGLAALFEDLGRTPPDDLPLLAYALEEVIGDALGAYPNADAPAALAWRTEALKWWARNAEKLVFGPGPEAGVLWSVPRLERQK